MPIPICDAAGNDASRLATRVLRDMNDGLLVLDPQGHILSCNGHATRMLGLSSEAAGQSYAALLGDGEQENDAFHQLILDAVYDKSAAHEGVAPYRSGGGEPRRLKVTTSFLLDEEGARRMGVVVILSDVTEVERLQRQRRESSTNFAILMCGVSLFLFLWSAMVYAGIAPPPWVMTQLIHVLALIMLILSLKTTSLSLRDIGLRVENPKKTFLPSILIAVGGTAILVGAKILLLRVAPGFFPAGAPFWDWSVGNMSDVLYPLTVLLQEFLARGAMQANLKRIFVGKHAGALSILVSSLIFGVLHISYGLPLMLGAALLMGVLGVLYEKQGNLWGLSIVHYVLGEAVTFLRYTI